MKKLKELFAIADEFPCPMIFVGILILIVVCMLCTMWELKVKHEYRMELLKQGKVSIESIK
jgi:hypothetical protein